MKHLLTLTFAIALMLPLQQAHAQEKQNDATWEETVEFIDKYKDYIVDSEESLEFNFEYFRIYGTNIAETYIEFRYFYAGWNTITADLKYLLSAKIYEDNLTRISIKLSGDYFIKKHIPKSGGDPVISDYSTEYFTVADIEMRPRLLKAFQHLAYLANEKREEDRLKSGDAF